VIGLIDNGACNPSKTASPTDTNLVDITGCDGLLFADGTSWQSKYVPIAMKSIDLAKPWWSMVGSPVRVVVRAHTNDPSAAQCTAAYRTACKNALVIDTVVWHS
jgi:hypothetical protein